jgi:hypothetical protein
MRVKLNQTLSFAKNAKTCIFYESDIFKGIMKFNVQGIAFTFLI